MMRRHWFVLGFVFGMGTMELVVRAVFYYHGVCQ